MNTVAIIQARMGSRRLPGKSLMKVGEYTLLETVVRSVKRNHFIDKVIVATSNLSIDDAIEHKCQSISVECYRGHPENVLSRFIDVAKNLNPDDIVVRVTADNPINDQKVTQILFEEHLKQNADYTCVENLAHTAYEFIKADKLLSLEHNPNLDDQDKEHVTKYLREHTDQFNVVALKPETLNINTTLDKQLTIDTEEDYLRLKEIAEKIDINHQVDMLELYRILEEKN